MCFAPNYAEKSVFALRDQSHIRFENDIWVGRFYCSRGGSLISMSHELWPTSELSEIRCDT